MKKTTRDTVIGVLHMICVTMLAVLAGVELVRAYDLVSKHNFHNASFCVFNALGALVLAHAVGENYRRIRRL